MGVGDNDLFPRFDLLKKTPHQTTDTAGLIEQRPDIAFHFPVLPAVVHDCAHIARFRNKFVRQQGLFQQLIGIHFLQSDKIGRCLFDDLHHQRHAVLHLHFATPPDPGQDVVGHDPQIGPFRPCSAGFIIFHDFDFTAGLTVKGRDGFLIQQDLPELSRIQRFIQHDPIRFQRQSCDHVINRFCGHQVNFVALFFHRLYMPDGGFFQISRNGQPRFSVSMIDCFFRQKQCAFRHFIHQLHVIHPCQFFSG